MKWVAMVLGLLVLALVAGVVALTMRGDGQGVRAAVTSPRTAVVDPLKRVLTTEGSSLLGANGRCRRESAEDSDASGDDRSNRAHTTKPCRADREDDNAGDNETGDDRSDESGDDQAGDNENGGD
jgi:hypothetical protein